MTDSPPGAPRARPGSRTAPASPAVPEAPRPAVVPSAAALSAAAALLLALGPAAEPAAAQDAEAGREIYVRWCAECHGDEGAGDGPAADRMLPRPRDFTEARYQIRSTPSGALPTDGDLMAAVLHGLPGTTMPGWPNLTAADRRDLVAYLKSLSPFFERLGPPDSLRFESPPGGGEEAVAAGREVYQTLECYRCHGQEGRGDGPSAPTLTDWRELPVRAADLTEPWLFNGGSSVEEVHRRFLTGLDGTPMPTQADAMASGVVDSTDLWNLAYYVGSLAPDRVPPRVEDAVRVTRVPEGELPSSVADSAWREMRRFYFPLAGQVIEQPRQFEPMVDGVWVEGAHDGQELVLRVSWNDPSMSPDSAWMEWQRKVADALDDDGTPWPTDSLPDRMAVQFPTRVPEGRELPYFLMGSPQHPVYLWDWSSRGGVREATATGLGTAGPLGRTGVEASARWEAGRWRVLFRRSLDAEGQRTSFPAGIAVPVAFYAWDGNNAESGRRAAVSSWYFLILEQPTGSDVYVIPGLAMLLVLGLGLFVTRRARRAGGSTGDAEAMRAGGPAAGDGPAEAEP